MSNNIHKPFMSNEKWDRYTKAYKFYILKKDSNKISRRIIIKLESILDLYRILLLPDQVEAKRVGNTFGSLFTFHRKS